ncbi:4-hydroxy-3-methylbut-2-en-1-yl diphosphatesynthase [Striga asiatica]|uniref:4-hydroxy-3-methylbut-2-en-1-yl diphosphatesynthase n=1 Tax=Striga asiatica TaxID=4170 RepID=A0A5A7PAP3_STRAF|nr:4-hydroxy-3-methylbut-2-en-1-yl diphosphatesynthase [Striga asiatica]
MALAKSEANRAPAKKDLVRLKETPPLTKVLKVVVVEPVGGYKVEWGKVAIPTRLRARLSPQTGKEWIDIRAIAVDPASEQEALRLPDHVIRPSRVENGPGSSRFAASRLAVVESLLPSLTFHDGPRT